MKMSAERLSNRLVATMEGHRRIPSFPKDAMLTYVKESCNKDIWTQMQQTQDTSKQKQYAKVTSHFQTFNNDSYNYNWYVHIIFYEFSLF